MQALKQRRQDLHLSQRRLAAAAGISYKSLQLIETGDHDVRLSTLAKLSRVLGISKRSFLKYIEYFFSIPVDSIAMACWRVFISLNRINTMVSGLVR